MFGLDGTKEKKIVTENKEMAEILNQFFSSVFTKEDLSYIPDAEVENVERIMRPVKVTRREVEKKIRNLRKDAAAGPEVSHQDCLRILRPSSQSR
jgi:hypothetical protein